MEDLNKLYESIDKKPGDNNAKAELKKQIKEYIEEIKTTGNSEKLSVVFMLLQKFIEEQGEIKKLSIDKSFAQKRQTIGELFNLKTDYEAKRNERENSDTTTYKEYIEKNDFQKMRFEGYFDLKNIQIQGRKINEMGHNNYEIAVLVNDPQGVREINSVFSGLKTNDHTLKGTDFSITYTTKEGVLKNVLLGDLLVKTGSISDKTYITKISVFKE